MQFDFDTSKLSDYRTFLKIRTMPRYRFDGWRASIPDEDAAAFGLGRPDANGVASDDYRPSPFLFDYQSAIAAMAIRRRRFAAFVDCGLGKTLIITEFARHAENATGKPVLLISPLMVLPQTVAEFRKFYPSETAPTVIRANGLREWLATGTGLGITNWDALTEDFDGSRLGGIVADESSYLKSHYGAWGQSLVSLGRGVPYKLCATGTPAPNDRIEYAQHAVFLDQARTVNEFLARFFINRGETNERWELKPHALVPFYRFLSTWSIFVSNPATYGWKDNSGGIPPMHVHIHDVPLTTQQRELAQKETGGIFVTGVGGIGGRSKLAQLSKGRFDGQSVDTNKIGYIRDLVASWPDESTIIWCLYNAEHDMVADAFPGCANIDGSTEYDDRVRLVEEFKAGRRKVLVSKPKILGFGLNLQIATRHVFSGLQDSYESFYQAVKRSNRIGSDKPLNVHIPVTEIEAPMVNSVLVKAKRVDADTREQERIYKEQRFEM
jgi:hypothetical protein